jgi:AcrR family transcriptional regulator
MRDGQLVMSRERRGTLGAMTMTTPQQRVDRRMQRTRQVIQQAFREVVQEKGFTATSIREITERADINRGTFYLHFADKYTLAAAVVRDVFHQELMRSLPAAPGWDRSCLSVLIQAVLACLEGKYRHQPRPLYALAEVAPLVEQAMQAELYAVLLTWLQAGQGAERHWSIPRERLARIASWAIFGTALEWSQEPMTVSADAMARTIELVVMDGLGHLL